MKWHLQGVQGKCWRQGQGWGEVPKCQQETHAQGRECPVLEMAMFSLPKAVGIIWQEGKSIRSAVCSGTWSYLRQ